MTKSSAQKLLIAIVLVGLGWYGSQTMPVAGLPPADGHPAPAQSITLANNLIAAISPTRADPFVPTGTGPLQLAARSKTSSCQINGPLPDPLCTPGAVFASATPDQICKEGYSRSVRSVSVSLKKRVYQEYGLSYPQPTGSYEVDHLIPLELGGSNDIANLFPEAAKPTPGFREKDIVENYLHGEMCEGTVNLARAQEQIAADWTIVYDHITPAQRAALLQQFRNWAD